MTVPLDVHQLAVELVSDHSVLVLLGLEVDELALSKIDVGRGLRHAVEREEP